MQVVSSTQLELSKLRMLSDNSTLIRAINNDAQIYKNSLLCLSRSLLLMFLGLPMWKPID
ncbi:hypothetical protein Bca52824_061579 [Brassica carinata]|uniref:Uncharacterized protein n=1 Tax=Brassica carinata TaxID=52824 RepID=A0A8X7R5P3_BRACI|nr:hypothetical protein Bca52824_061579 [Brassica carinata]